MGEGERIARADVCMVPVSQFDLRSRGWVKGVGQGEREGPAARVARVDPCSNVVYFDRVCTHSIGVSR